MPTVSSRYVRALLARPRIEATAICERRSCGPRPRADHLLVLTRAVSERDQRVAVDRELSRLGWRRVRWLASDTPETWCPDCVTRLVPRYRAALEVT